MIGLGGRGPTEGVDRDPVAAILAQANAAVYGCSIHVPRIADVTAMLHEVTGYWHFDPDRRPGGRRTTHLAAFEPNGEVVERLRRRQPDGAVKLAPATPIPADWPGNAEREWIGSRRECRQQVVWFGSLAQDPRTRRATVVGPNGESCSVTGQPDSDVGMTRPMGRYVFEPHAAVLAAQLIGSLAARHSLACLAPGIAYLTSDEHVASPLLAAFEVQEVLPFDSRKLRAALSARRVGRLEIKVRGVDVDPAPLRQQLKLKGDEELTLLIAGPPSNIRAILARRSLG
jgi:hypothetical protein